MESSSENSFTWTETSNDSGDSSVVAEINAPDSVHVNTESDTKHKMKKKSKILNNNDNRTKEEYNIMESAHYETKNECLHKKTVKLEPESDSEVPKKKRKLKHIEVNGNQNDFQNASCYDESYLDFKVKQEKISALSSTNQIKKKHKKSSLDGLKTVEELKCKDNGSDMNDESASQSILGETSSSSKSKKKKKKSKKECDSEDQEEMAIKSNEMKNTEKLQDLVTKSNVNGIKENLFNEISTFQDETGCEEISAIQCDGDDDMHIISFNDSQSTEVKRKNIDKLYRNTVDNQFKIANNNLDEANQLSLRAKQRTPHISDRICFEDSDDPETEISQAPVIETKTSKVKKYIKTISNMKLVSQNLQNNSILSHNDEIWIVKCPKEIDIQAFCGTELNIHSRCKIKIGGQTYDCSLEDEQCDTATAISMKHNKYEVENLPLCGIINLRKRIPKAHFRDDNTMVNNQTNFIPLPETKCRHPLFGSNYKKALKLPTAVAKRLNADNNVEATVAAEKKKKKKHKQEKIPHQKESDSKKEYVTKCEPNLCLEEVEKKSKKRKRIDNEGPAPKKLKKIKHDPESVEAWESEKAIEQTLFDF